MLTSTSPYIIIHWRQTTEISRQPPKIMGIVSGSIPAGGSLHTDSWGRVPKRGSSSVLRLGRVRESA